MHLQQYSGLWGTRTPGVHVMEYLNIILIGVSLLTLHLTQGLLSVHRFRYVNVGQSGKTRELHEVLPCISCYTFYYYAGIEGPPSIAPQARRALFRRGRVSVEGPEES